MPSAASSTFNEPELQGASRLGRKPMPLGVLAVIGALALILLVLIAWRPAPPSTAILAPAPRVRLPLPDRTLCDGDEAFCLSADSDQPAELLRRLAAALAVAPAQRYQIHLTITPLAEEPAPAHDAPPPPVPSAAAP